MTIGGGPGFESRLKKQKTIGSFFFSSVNWIVDQGQPEIVNGSTGKTINDSTSRLSKKCRES